MIPKPLGDKIIVEPLEHPGKIGLIHIPDAYKTQSTLTHYKGKVLASGPKAEEHCPVGSIVHLHEAWGEKFILEGKALFSGRLRDINGVLSQG
jgi:co-chaperonin GroES (HSP10)